VLIAGTLFRLGRVGQEHLVGLYDHTAAAQLTSVVSRGHRFANAMGQMPRGPHGAIQEPLHLSSADPFLARAHEMDDL
jgi:hypothetical protein